MNDPPLHPLARDYLKRLEESRRGACPAPGATS